MPRTCAVNWIQWTVGSSLLVFPTDQGRETRAGARDMTREFGQCHCHITPATGVENTAVFLLRLGLPVEKAVLDPQVPIEPVVEAADLPLQPRPLNT